MFMIKRTTISLIIGCILIGIITVVGVRLWLETNFSKNEDGEVLIGYVTNSRTNEVLVVDLINKAIKDRIPTGGPIHKGPFGIDITPDGEHIYVTNPELNNVLVINTNDHKIEATIPVGSYPMDIIISPDGKFAYIICEKSREIYIIETKSNTVTTVISVGIELGRATISPNGSLLLVLSGDKVLVIDTKTSRVKETIKVEDDGYRASDVAFTPDSRYAYVGSERAHDGYVPKIFVIDVEGSSVVNVIENVTLRPFPDSSINDLAVSPDGHLLYVADSNGHTLTIINTTTNTIIMKMKAKPPNTYGGPRMVVFSPDSRFAYLLYGGGIPIDAPVSEQSSAITIFDTSRFSWHEGLVATIMLGKHAGAMRMTIRTETK